MATGQNGTGMPPSAKAGSYQLKKLREVHHNILRMTVLGMRQVDIAKVLGCSIQMVYYTVNSELGQQKLAVLRGEADQGTLDVMRELKELSPLAVSVLEEVLLNPGARDSDKLKAAEHVLGGAGYGKQHKVDVNVHHVTDDDIQRARLAARERVANLRLNGAYEEAKIIDEASKDETS